MLRIATQEEIKNTCSEHLGKKYIFGNLNGKIFIICKNFRSLNFSKEIWYDDEQEAPQLSLEFFVNYNRSYENSRFQMYKHGQEFGIQEIYKNVPQLTYMDLNDPENQLLDLEEKEIFKLINFANVIIDEENEKFQKRLENYYKRYKSKIRIRGYWAWR